MKPRFSKTGGWLFPLIYYIFFVLKNISLLTIIRRIGQLFHRKWESQLFVDFYVIGWFVVGWIFVIYLSKNEATTIDSVVGIVFVVLLIWRLSDIIQVWFDVLFIPPVVPLQKPEAPRLIILTLVNYLELTIIFAVVGFLLRAGIYYEQFIWDSLRHSLGIITPLGVPSEPPSWTSGFLFYSEYFIGLLFLVVIINRVLSYFKT